MQHHYLIYRTRWKPLRLLFLNLTQGLRCRHQVINCHKIIIQILIDRIQFINNFSDILCLLCIICEFIHTFHNSGNCNIHKLFINTCLQRSFCCIRNLGSNWILLLIFIIGNRRMYQVIVRKTVHALTEISPMTIAA